MGRYETRQMGIRVMRDSHTLKPLQRSVMPEHVIFVDTETDAFPGTKGKTYQLLKLGVAIFARFRRDKKKDYKETYRFKTKEDFWVYIASKAMSKQVLYLISHNAVFDFTVLGHTEWLTKLGYKCQFVYDGGMTFIGKWRKKGHTVMILDNANWFKGTLAKWGKELDLPKLEMPKGLKDEEKWFTYCERDTEILYQLFKWYVAFLSSNNLGSWKYTIASSAFTSFRHRFMSHPIYIPAEDEDSDIARESYHGGRTECFQVGEYNDGPYYKLDINSMYPFVMRNNEYPTCYETRLSYPNMDKTRRTTETKCIIADCTLSTNIPYFVFRNDGRNIYPIGQFRTVLTTQEYQLAYDNRWIKEIHDVCVYRKRSIFRQYVDFFYKVKQDAGTSGKQLIRAFAKLYLNSLYGKFGQRGFVDRVLGDDNTATLRVSHGYNIRTGERFTIRQIGHQVLYSEKGGESYNAFCAIASHVTANARLYLYDSIQRMGRDNCFYCDTDSVICNSQGLEKIRGLLDNTKLGYWKVEGVSESIIITAPKHYTFGSKIVLKGVRKNAKKLGINTYKQEIWPGFNSILGQGQEKYYTFYQVKILSPSIKSGQVQNSGIITPFVLTE